jgi:hypothetical protein
MFRVTNLLRGLVLAGAVALISIPASAEAGGGFGFCGNYGGGFYGCFPNTIATRPAISRATGSWLPAGGDLSAGRGQPIAAGDQPWMYSKSNSRCSRKR